MYVGRVPAEDPNSEQWRLLSQFAYPANIARFLAKNGLPNADQADTDFLTGSLRQAQAYFTAAKNAPIDISPLLLYYGVSNLLGAAHVLRTSMRPLITDHGMRFERPPSAGRLGDIQISPVNPTSGALQIYSNLFSGRFPVTSTGPWTLLEILGSIPDVREDYLNTYPMAVPFTIPVEVVTTRRGTIERVLPADMTRFVPTDSAFAAGSGIAKAYLLPQATNNARYIVLRRKPATDEIGIHSLAGRKYLPLWHEKRTQHIDLDQKILMMMASFALGYASRYVPELWSRFVRTDDTGELLLVERFLATCHRYFPNIVLNTLLGERIQFVYTADDSQDLTPIYSGADIQQMVDERIREARSG